MTGHLRERVPMIAALALLLVIGVAFGLLGILVTGLLWLAITGIGLTLATIIAVVARAWNDYQHPLREETNPAPGDTIVPSSGDSGERK